MATADVPRLVRPVVRGLLSRIIGRNPVPEPLIAVRRARRRTAPALPYRWNPDYPARIGMLPRDADGDAVRWFEIDPCYVFHTLNAYDDGDTVVVDVVRHPKMFATVLTGPDEGPATLTRFTLDLATGTATEVGIDQRSQEFPRHDERLTGRRHRYGYAVGFEDGATGDTVLRHDLDAGATDDPQPGRRPRGQRVLLRAPTRRHRRGRRRADGLRLRPGRGRSQLRVLDAATLEDVATVHLPGRVPAGFHGNWAPPTDLLI